VSKTIRIVQAKQDTQLTGVDRITTAVEGGNAGWFPYDETIGGVKEVTENGEYVPYDDGVYGYLIVHVNVPGGASYADDDGNTVSPGAGSTGSSITGTDPDTGETVTIEVIDVDGTPTLTRRDG
jgi:hypothetical protein